MRIRDHMDDILEARGYYRKHVAHEADSLFRSAADVMFHTQQHWAEVLKHAVKVRRAQETKGERREDEERQEGHQLVRALADIFQIEVEVLETSNPDISTICISPRPEEGTGPRPADRKRPLLASEDCVPPPPKGEEENRRKKKSAAAAASALDVCGRGSSSKTRTLLLCYSAPCQYDPIYPKKTIDNAAMVQSVLYEMLYRDVFNIEDAFKAADYMLNGAFDPRYGKPEVYDKDFEGTAMEALDRFLIPFPYKVAKALDPESYRNIEYDVWSNERRSSSSSSSSAANPSSSSSPSSPSTSLQTIGSLSYGTPCLIRYPVYGELYGFVMQPTHDRRHMEVYIPVYDSCVYVPRKMILPVKNPPQDILSWSSSPSAVAMARLFYCHSPGQEAGSNRVPELSFDSPPLSLKDSSDIQNSNLSLATARDPDWLVKSDFTVPPPPFYPVGPPNAETLTPEMVRQTAAMTSAAAVAQQQQEVDMAAAAAAAFPPLSMDPAIQCSIDQHGNLNFGGPNVPPSLYLPSIFSAPFTPTIGPAGDIAFAQPQQQPLAFNPAAPQSPLATPFFFYDLNSQSPLVPAIGGGGGAPMTPVTPMFNNALQVFQFPSPPATPYVTTAAAAAAQTQMTAAQGFVFPSNPPVQQ